MCRFVIRKSNKWWKFENSTLVVCNVIGWSKFNAKSLWDNLWVANATMHSLQKCIYDKLYMEKFVLSVHSNFEIGRKHYKQEAEAWKQAGKKLKRIKVKRKFGLYNFWFVIFFWNKYRWQKSIRVESLIITKCMHYHVHDCNLQLY